MMADSASETSFLKDFKIPDYILAPEPKDGFHHEPPKYPVIIFINSKSGGQLGGDLLHTYRSILNKNQVFDLGEEAPDQVLRRIYGNLERLKSEADELAKHIEEKLRLIVAGGDGTAGWLLGVVSDLKLSQPPPIATVPLGTGNNLPFAFGWGKRNPGTDCHSVESFLAQVKEAKEMKIDSWHIVMRMRPPKEGSCDPIAPLELPHSLHAFQRVSETDKLNKYLLAKSSSYTSKLGTSCQEGCVTFRGGFWNYFSMGMDAQVSYAFHSERKLHPEKFKNQLANQVLLFHLGVVRDESLMHGDVCKDWVYPRLVLCFPFPSLFPVSVDIKQRITVFSSSSLSFLDLCCNEVFLDTFQQSEYKSQRNIAQLAKVFTMKSPGQWEELPIHHSIRSIVCLNLPSFSGGLNPWGTPNIRKRRDRDLTPPYVDDGLLEVVGFRDAWHGLVLLAPNGHGTRLAQAHRIRFEFHKGAADHTYMRIDGEPWKQPLPVDDDTVVVEISHLGQVNMLATRDCRSKSIFDPSTPSHGGDEDDSNGEDFGEEGEEYRKFGAADTFKIPEGVDISHIS
ncbi:hypothetical protein TIFTF001_030291 [Ficus carica]|uniref:Diacylglycerol kinase n=2 Tax=Magnoliopsida TaxID=3398 RepID=A0AA88DXB4_FICCA|nr:hypothetical protein TIFTF001_030291 [Ficus carica]